jgi:hypothetical protein
MVRVGVLSQNMGELKIQPNINDNTVITLNPDIYVEMTQEDGRIPDGSPIINKSTILSTYRLLDSVSLNGKQQTHQNVALNMYIKNDAPMAEFKIINKGTGVIAPKGSSLRLFAQEIAKTLHTGYGYSKGMVYAKITTPNRPILFVNMHLPMKATVVDGKLKNATLGLEFRKVSFFNLLVKLKSDGLLEDRPLLFVGGDLNFRMDLSGINQLNTIIKNEPRLLYGLKELESPNGESAGITCKFATEKHDYECRSRKLPKNQTNMPQFLETIQKNCGEPLRTPSRCDRFLVSSDVEQIEVLLNTSKYLLLESDHNAIMCCFQMLDKSPNLVKTGGRGRTFKIKNKTRNARLRNKSRVASR